MSNLKIMLLATGAAVTLISGNAYAGACDVNVEATATMAFSVKEIKVPKKCKEITLKLTNTGTMPKAIMGHNIVISKTSDIEEVNKNGMVAGLANNYVKKNDTKVIGHTTVIGGGESTTAKIKLTNLKPSESYSFFCSFPGHSAIMKGVFKLI